jgi:ribonuclease HI
MRANKTVNVWSDVDDFLACIVKIEPSTIFSQLRTEMYYAVLRGRQPGIYKSWTECQREVKGIAGALYRKFETLSDAEEYMKRPLPAHAGKKRIPSVTNNELVTSWNPNFFVYTDGACIGNGTDRAVAGIGVYFGPGDPRNVSRSIVGKQTNNTAELTAVIEAIRILQSDFRAGKRIVIVSDSEYTIRCATTYGQRMSAEGWKKDIPNKELVRALHDAVSSVGESLRFLHIMSHLEGGDPHTVGNAEADRLANEAVGLSATRHPDAAASSKKQYIAVSYICKDDAKKKGARWDPSAKKWYISRDSPHFDELMSQFGPL